jgi:DNA-binding NarL/FixJ family response regulator
VLIVDDEPETCVLLRAILEEEGIHVLGTATGGIEGVAEARALEPGVVLMDLRMPDLDGLAATRQIKAHRPETQVIFLTFYEEAELTAAAEEVDAFCYLVKGCPPSLIVDMVRRASASHAVGTVLAHGPKLGAAAASKTRGGLPRDDASRL